jgi:hypothetical protein
MVSFLHVGMNGTTGPVDALAAGVKSHALQRLQR